MRAVLTGATGLLGGAVLARLLADGHRVLALGRKPDRMRELLPPEVDVDHFDLSAPAAPGKLQAGDVVFHCAALLGNAKVDREEYLRCNTESVRVLALAARDAGASLFQFISSVSANGPEGRQDSALREDSPFLPVSVYGESKALAERELAQIEGLPVQILRPPVIYGPGANRSSSASKIFRLLRGKIFLKGGSNYFNVIALENLVDACVFLATSQGALRQCSGQGKADNFPPNPGTWMVRDEPAPSMRAFQDLICEAYGRYPKRIPLPYAAFYLLGQLGDFLRGRGLSFPLTTEIARGFATSGYWSDQTKLLALGWKPPFATKDAVERTAQAYLD